MKILIYSDLHLEFRNPIKPPENSCADLMVLAGDIIILTEEGFEKLSEFLKEWTKPVLFIAGNHEYYTREPMDEGVRKLKRFIADNAVNIKWLNDDEFSYRDVAFFGGTMWTDFNNSNPISMFNAHRGMNDYKEIFLTKNKTLYPAATVDMHKTFKEELIDWLEEHKNKKRVVISHHAPCQNPNSNFKQSKLEGAFISLDMIEVIEKYQPDLWIYGHTHETDDQMIGKTRIISNPFGYYKHQECKKFNSELIIEI